MQHTDLLSFFTPLVPFKFKVVKSYPGIYLEERGEAPRAGHIHQREYREN